LIEDARSNERCSSDWQRSPATAVVRLRLRPRATTLVIVVALLNAALYHWPLYSYAATHLDLWSFNGVLTLSTLYALVGFVTAVALSAACLVSQRLLKPLCMLGAVLNACALYFIHTYGVILDKTMMGNVANTDFVEATAFLHPKLLLYLLLLGLLPCAVLTRVDIHQVRRTRVAALTLALLVAGVGWMYLASGTWLWIDKHASTLGGMTLPWSYAVNLTRHRMVELAASRQPIALPDASFGSDERTVVVLVIGESARAPSFSLYGYARATNPVLSAAGVVALRNAHACATYTTAALLCILSPDDPGLRLSGSSELLPSYLERHGIDVIWRTNNWGEPPLRVATYERAKDLTPNCRGDLCTHDDLLLHGLEQRIRASPRRKVFVVLHQSGSHGPSYSTKYPPPFDVFRPACKSVELNQCTREELVNAYDNTILYTDHVVGRAIGMLKSLGDVSATLLYISDHGESLGEYGLYLHGTPLLIAPDVQKNVPFVVWMSDAFKRQHKVDEARLARRTEHSQANVFHSVMGAFDMRSSVYVRRLDIFGAAEPSAAGPLASAFVPPK